MFASVGTQDMMNSKALTLRSGVLDGDYGQPASPGQENVYQRSMRLGSPLTSPTQKHVDGINGQTVLEGYREELMNSFASQMARYNPLNVQRPQSSMLLNVNDPIQVHLLVETALGDSSEYEVLSPEEVDNLKKQCQSLTQRIKQTQQNLAIQSKYRDASISMSKLYNPSDKKESRKRSVLSHHKSDSVKEADIERMRCEERCEELALELWSLEKRLIEPQKRLLKHTAGVLQMTHKGPEKVTNGQGVQQNGIPGSPESMYTYHNSKNSLGPSLDDDLFDDRSLYRDADKLETYGETPKRNGFEPHPLSLPSKTQGREQMQMAKTEKKLEDLNGKLREAIIRANPDREQTLGQIPTSKVSNGRSMDANETLTSHLDFLEKGIDVLSEEHGQLSSYQDELLDKHEILEEEHRKATSTTQDLLQKQKDLLTNHDDSDSYQQELLQKLDALDEENSKLTEHQEQLLKKHEEVVKKLEDMDNMQAEFDRQMEEAERRQEESDAAMEETIEDMNREIRGILLSYDPNRPELPELTGTGLQNQLLYFQESVRVIEAELAHSHDYSSIKAINNDTGQMETILMGLWDIIQSGYGEIRKQKQERRINRSANGLPDDDESDDDGGDSDETYSLQAFSKKVQWLYGQATKLKDQKKVLQVQIKQQRELNNKSDATKDTEMRQKSEELERTRSLLVRAEADSDRVREQLSEVMEKLNEARQNENLLDQQRSTSESSAVRAAQDESNQRLAIIQKLEGELEELKDDHSIAGAEFKAKLSTAESRIAEMTAQLKAATEEKAQWKDSMVERDVAIEQKEHEMENMKMKLAELQTEVTIARAELDGAYGSRAQRAAEVAANPVIAREIDSLTRNNASLAAEITELKSASASAGQGSKDSDQRIEVLKKELTETIEDYEKMTKANIEWEKERERLEETIDKLRDQREQLEAELSDEKVRWLGMRSPIGMDGPPSEAGRTSTTVLKEEFKKMMRTTRADSAKVVRAEQAERRRLEDELRSLKKSLGPGKSNLGQNLRPA